MIPFFTYRVNRIAVRIAVASFSIGNLLFLVALFLDGGIMGGLGIIFLLTYAVVFGFSMFMLAMNLLINFKDIQEHMAAIIITFLNIPLALLYLSFF